MPDLSLILAQLMASEPASAPSLPDRTIVTLRSQPDLPDLVPEPLTPNPYLPDVGFSSSVRPQSGSQLYQQRLEALRHGKTYTRLPAHSFYETWINATPSPTHEQWVTLLQREATAMANGQGRNRLTVMVGDSLSQWFPIDQLPSDRFWLNQGISGDTTTGILQRLSAFDQTRPDVILVMAGINDLKTGATDAAILDNLQAIMQQLRQRHPQAKIIIHSILPTRLANLPSDRIERLNQQIAQLTQQESVNYLDLTPYFADQDGILKSELTTDGLHLSTIGYALWGWAVRSFRSV